MEKLYNLSELLNKTQKQIDDIDIISNASFQLRGISKKSWDKRDTVPIHKDHLLLYYLNVCRNNGHFNPRENFFFKRDLYSEGFRGIYFTFHYKDYYIIHPNIGIYRIEDNEYPVTIEWKSND